MPFTKQDKNINRNGRTKGTPNKNTKEIKELLSNLFSDNLEYIADYSADFTLNERLQLLKMLLPYVVTIPKGQSEHVEMPLFPDVNTDDCRTEFDIKDLFKIDPFIQEQ